MVVAVEYISKEESTDVAEGAASAQHGVTGILAVQGAFAEHAAMLDRLGAPWKLLRAAEDFDDSIDRVILPGGESTTQGKLLRSTGLFEPIAAHIAAGKPVFGTCAGMILLARRLDNDENVYFGALDAVVRRNAYGRQLGSFAASADFGASDDADAVVVASGSLSLLRFPRLLVRRGLPRLRIRRWCSRISLWCSFADRSLPRSASGPRSKRRSTAMWSVCVRARFSLRRSTPN